MKRTGVLKMIERDVYIQKIQPFIDKPIIKVLTGIRRCGKSVMLNLIMDKLRTMDVAEEQIAYINFESGQWIREQSADTLYQFIQQKTLPDKRLYLFLDEIQEIDGWQKILNACLIDFNIDIFITGSNAKLLSGELATYLGGRYVEFKIFPLSFLEIRQAQTANQENISETDSFIKYLKYGGMPFLYQYQLDDFSAKAYLTDIYDSIILKDIASRNQIRDIDLLKRVLLFLLSNIGQPFSATSLSKFLIHDKRKFSTETIYNYIDYAKTAFLIHLVSRENVVGKQLLSFQEKIYLNDHGLREAVYGYNEQDIGQVLENIVFIELLRRGYLVRVGKNALKEIDFVAERQEERIYIQVAYLLASDETVEREFSPLETIPDQYPKYVISMDEINRSRKGIRHLNIRKFLLDGDSGDPYNL
jgi:uncharacterized protein